MLKHSSRPNGTDVAVEDIEVEAEVDSLRLALVD
jgi:hypothetical protein